MFASIETKVVASIAGATGGSAAATFVLWLLGVVFFGGSATATAAVDAAQRVPEPVTGVVLILLSAIGAGVAGYKAPHTTRVDAPVETTPVSAPQSDAAPLLADDVAVEEIPAAS